MARRSLALPLATTLLLLVPGATAPRAAHAGPAGRGHHDTFYYTAPADILRGQHALESIGLLARADYSPGEYDAPTRRAIERFQSDHFLRRTGYLHNDTYAMLPIDERPDQDDDGVPDADDRCPSTPKRGPKKEPMRVGHDGCPVAKS